MDLSYLIQLDPVYRVLSRYLRTSDRLRLRQVSKSLNELVTGNPNTWKFLDFTARSKDVVNHFLSYDAVPGALQELILDCTDVSEMTVTVTLMRCAQLRVIGLGGCTELMDGVILAVLQCKRNGHAQRLKKVGLLGAPYFKSTGVSPMAASVVRDCTAVGLETDLVRCPQEHAFTSDPAEHWHLCVERPATCIGCKKKTRGCYPCINSRTCRGCFKFWCYDCANPITRVCYECGHSCPDCKKGIYIKCKDCKSMFCKLHRTTDPVPITEYALSGRTQRTSTVTTAMDGLCDWCIQGRCSGFGH